VDTVERRIHFFRADLGLDDDGVPVALDISVLRNEIKKLKWIPGERYLEQRNGNLTYARLPKEKQGLILGLSRRSDLPQLEKDGQTSPLTLDNDSGVAELTHFRFFANNIVACEYNHFGPRASRLVDYVTKSVPNCPSFDLRPLLNHDVAKLLSHMKEVTMVTVKMTASTASDWVGTGDSFYGALERLEASGQSATAEVILKAPKKETLGTPWLKRLRRFTEKPDLLEATERLIAKGVLDNGKIETVDLLSDKLISKQAVARVNKRSRAVLTDDMMKVMSEAYLELKPQLLKSAATIAVEQ
jgi:hypothetical protein